MNPPILPVTVTPPNIRRIKRIAPLQLGKMSALLYGCMGLLALPIFLVMSIAASQMPAAQRGIMAAVGIGFAICMPIFYAVIGFLVGVVGALIYNVAAKWIGGIEVEVE